MSNKSERKKKDGEGKGKKMQAMRESVRERQQRAAPERPSRDETDKVKFKRGGGSDKRTNPASRGPR